MFFRVSNGAGVKPQGTATPEDVLANKTFSNDTGVGVPGTMVNNTGWTGEGTPTGNNQVDVTIPRGYHDGTGKVTCKGQTAYAAGVSAGQGSARIGTAGAGDVLAGKTFTNASASGISGSMVNRGAWSTNATANGAVAIPAGYHNGGGRVNVNVEPETRQFTATRYLSGAGPDYKFNLHDLMGGYDVWKILGVKDIDVKSNDNPPFSDPRFVYNHEYLTIREYNSVEVTITFTVLYTEI